MANYATLKAAIQNVIKTNGNNEITGALLQQSLLSMINSLGANYQFAGIAKPSTNPGTPDQNVFYIASDAGQYVNFTGTTLGDGDVCIFAYSGSWVAMSTNIANKKSLQYITLRIDAQDNEIGNASTREYTLNDRLPILWNGTAVAAASLPWGAFVLTLSPGAHYDITGSVSTVRAFSSYPQIGDTNGLNVGTSFTASSSYKYALITHNFNNEDVAVTVTERGLSKRITLLAEKVAENVAEIVSLNGRVGFADASKTLTSDDYAGKYYGGTGTNLRVLPSSSPFNGFIINVANKHINWESITGVVSIMPFNDYPEIDMVSPYSDVKSLMTFTGDDTKKYLLVTLNTNLATTFSYSVVANGLVAQMAVVQNDVQDIKANIVIEIQLTALTRNRGLIESANSIYKDGDTTYPYTYAIYEVTPGWDYLVTGHSVNQQYCCASAGKSDDASAKYKLLVGNNKDYTRERVTIPAGYNRLYVNQRYSGGRTYPIVWELNPEINKQVEENTRRLNDLVTPTTDVVLESGSNLSQDEINGISSKILKLEHTNTSTPVVAFIYDDSFSADLVTLFNERGLKVSFAMIGNVNKSAWATAGNALRSIQKDGHGTVAHGVVGGVTVTGDAINNMNDHDAKIALDGENKAFDDYKLSHRGLVEFNSWADRAHTWTIIARYYDYLVGFGTPINTPGQTSLYQLGRFNTDNETMLQDAKDYVDSAINRGNCLLIFGGHFPSRTGSGAPGYSTMADFLALLDYVKEKVDGGQLLTMNIDDAVNTVWSRHGGVFKRDFRFENPSVGEIQIDGGLKYCSNKGTRAIYAMGITGTPTDGSFDLTLGNTTKSTDVSTGQVLTIETLSTDTIQDVIDKVLAKIFYAYTVRQHDSATIRMYRDVIGVTFTPEISNNTSGLTFSITQISAGVAAVWE